jgi:hypothetical protein
MAAADAGYLPITADGSQVAMPGKMTSSVVASTSSSANGIAALAMKAAHALQHEEVEAHRRRDLGQLDHEDDVDAEPDGVETGTPAPWAAPPPWSARSSTRRPARSPCIR